MPRRAVCLLLSLLALVPVECLPGKLTHADIARATIEGGNVRLAAALARPNITFGVLGGSITTGHGASDYNSSWWPSFERLLRAHQRFAGKSLRFVNGAVAGTNSDFAALCVETLLPRDVDVVFIEFDINTGGLGAMGTAKSWWSVPHAQPARRAPVPYGPSRYGSIVRHSFVRHVLWPKLTGRS